MALLTNLTPTALWHDIIHEAEVACTITLKEEIQAYLVFLLIRYINKPEFVKQIIANDFMEGLSFSPRKRELAMQEIGDKCLLFSGLFPHMAEKRMVKVSYFVNIGQSAYDNISKNSTDLYGMLARQFVPLMDILQSIRRYSRQISDLMPIEAYDLWNDCHSQRSLKVLSQHSQAIPVISLNTDKNKQ